MIFENFIEDKDIIEDCDISFTQKDNEDNFFEIIETETEDGMRAYIVQFYKACSRVATKLYTIIDSEKELEDVINKMITEIYNS